MVAIFIEKAIDSLGGGFKYSLFSPLGQMIQFDLYFSRGLKPPTRKPIDSRLQFPDALNKFSGESVK